MPTNARLSSGCTTNRNARSIIGAAIPTSSECQLCSVFTSEWHRHRFVDTFELPLQRCRVIRNAIHTNETARPWPQSQPWRWRCAYISAPHRGLDVLLEAWDELSPQQAELHIWSGYALWNMEEQQRELFSRAMEIPNVIYHRIAPNATVRAALSDMHFLLYPTCTYDETLPAHLHGRSHVGRVPRDRPIPLGGAHRDECGRFAASI